MDVPNDRRAAWRLPIQMAPGVAFGVTLASAAVAFALLYAAARILPRGYAWPVLLPVVAVSALLFGVRAASLVAALSGIAIMVGSVSPRPILAVLLFTAVAIFQLAQIGWLQHANARLAREREDSRAVAETRELLFRELQHRVSNNLQMVASVIALQKQEIADPTARTALDMAALRLSVIGRISRQLYPTDGARRSMKLVLEGLCADVLEISGREDISFDFEASTDALLGPQVAVPLGLIVVELVSNAIEHGVGLREGGTIIVALDRDTPNLLRVEVRDDGHGLPPDFDLATHGGLGLQIAEMLARKIKGQLELEHAGGVIARLRMPG